MISNITIKLKKTIHTDYILKVILDGAVRREEGLIAV